MADEQLRLEWIDPKTLTPNPSNWRVHPPAQREALAGVLEEVGWAGALLWNERTERLVDGHLRLDVALRENRDAVPVLIGSWSDAQEKEILATLDPIAAMAEADSAQLDALLREVNSGSAAVMDMLAGLAEGAGLYLDEKPIGAGGDEFDSSVQEGETRAKRGDLWSLGSHRLLVGDCTVKANVERLMGGEKAGMVFTDPPYGVNYDGGLNERKRERLAGDDSGDLYGKALPVIVGACAENAPLYIWFAASVGKPVYDAVHAIGYQVRAMIVWNKLNAHYGNFMAQYMQKHEPCLYCVNGNASWIGATNEVTVWDVEQASINEFHPTQKPLALAERAIGNHEADIVFDGFLGSGTALIACERLNRKCYGMEISEQYADVIIRRYEAETGQEAQLVERVTDE